MPNAPIHRSIRREGLSVREKGRRNGKEERAVDDSRILDGWSLIMGAPEEAHKPRFVYIDSTSS